MKKAPSLLLRIAVKLRVAPLLNVGNSAALKATAACMDMDGSGMSAGMIANLDAFCFQQ